jgi:hypothetical protein
MTGLPFSTTYLDALLDDHPPERAQIVPLQTGAPQSRRLP